MRWGRFVAQNYRGVRLPRVLGVGLAGAALLSTLAVAATSRVEAAGWGALAGTLLVFTAGLIDDLYPIGPRGLRNHLRSLVRGHMTTGILKMMAIGACAIIVVALQPIRPGWIRVTGVVLVAACANVWNGLDVAPGRALKAFLPVVAAVIIAGLPLELAPTVPGVAAGAVAALPPDVREKAMLGDGGANLLGFTAGLGLYLVLPGWGVGIAAALAVLLNVLADTVTLSRVIDAAAPLRWLDGLGRLRTGG
jgi:hypothetical protein